MSHASRTHRSPGAARPLFRATELAAACAVVLAGTAGAQAQQAPAAAAPASAQTVVVKGIRSSLESSLEMKRDAQGWVDGISATDIGKFPDTNLAESLQRISGVSIDRTAIGEGSRITVRGAGPEFNLVLLNGRQMPASSIADTEASSSRAFDFANLAAEAVAGIEVFKTSRASTPTGGIGATVNIKTARPLDAPGQRGSIGIKGVIDTSNGRLPSTMAGDELTPEISGIYSNTFGGGKFGVAISASYQERDLGYNQAAVGGGWIVARGNGGALAAPANNPADIINRPDPDDLYSLPQNLIYSVNGVQRQRTNGQLVLQAAPTKNLTATLDFTYSELKLQTKRNELSAWFNFGPSSSSWTDGPIASPKFYSETLGPGNSPLRRGLADLAMAGADYATKNENKSTGLNVNWKVSDRLRLEFDAHSSTAESGADSPFGSNNSLGTASFNRATTSVDFTREFPVLSIYDSDINPALMKVTGSSFRNSYMKSGVDQVQLKGQFKLNEESKLDFGLSLTKVKNRSAFANVQQDDWGGSLTDVGDFPDNVWRADQIRPYFQQLDGSGSQALYNQFFTWNFARVRELAAAARGNQAMFMPSNAFTTDRRVVEESQSAYVQHVKDWELFTMPARTALGVRLEKTDVTARALVPVATGINWTSVNEYPIQFADSRGFTELTGSYQHVLPSLDFDIDLRADLRARASYGETIGRPGWNSIQGGQTINALARIDGGTGEQGNPALKPLKSKNIDLSLEWYYAKGSYAAVGYFSKKIDNFLGVTQINATPFNLRTPVRGAFWNEAVAARCPDEDPACIREYIFETYDGRFGVDAEAQVIPAQPGDPIANFRITAPVNQRAASLDGLEFNVQHMLGNSGFGISANYTYVNSGLKYDNNSIGEQFALEGLSDSANLVVFFENKHWEIRAAYNWRDKFLTGRFDGKGPNPVYTEAYGQLDINATFKVSDRFSLHAEVINATDSTQRLHGRAWEQALYVTQTGPRYMFGANLKF